MAQNAAATQQAQVAAVLQARHIYAQTARQLVDAPFAQIAYASNGRGSVPIPQGFLLGGLIAHVHLPVTLNLNAGAAPALSPVAENAAIEEIFLNYNGSEATIWSADSIFTSQRMAMEHPAGSMSFANNVPVPAGAGTNYTYDYYYEIPAVYAWGSLLGILNMNSNQINASVGVRWGNVSNMFSLSAGQTATVNGGYVEFIAMRETQPQNVATDGLPDLSKTYAVSYQDFALNASGWNKLNIQADNTLTRITVNLLEGGTGNGSDVASYDSTNALQLQTVKFGWASLINKLDSVPYDYFQAQAALNYGQAFQKWINKGTIVIDLDQHGGRDWVDAADVTSLALSLFLGSAPPAGSKARVCLEQIVNSSVVPIRQVG